jgi:hypothetical protein
MDALWLLSNLVLWVGALALGFLLVGALRALRVWTWRLEQLEVALSSRPQLWQAGRYVPGPFSVGGPWASNANPVTISGASADEGGLGGAVCHQLHQRSAAVRLPHGAGATSYSPTARSIFSAPAWTSGCWLPWPHGRAAKWCRRTAGKASGVTVYLDAYTVTHTTNNTAAIDPDIDGTYILT